MPGTLTAVSCDNSGRELGRSELYSAQGRSAVKISPEKTKINQEEVLYVNIDIAGENGMIQCNDDRKLHVTVEGGQLLAFGSANPRTEERFDEGSYTTYYGRALAVVKGTKEGILTVKVSGEGLEDQTASVEVKAVSYMS